MKKTRRAVVVAIPQLATAAMLAVCARAADQHAVSAASEPALQLLTGVVYDILPYAELPAESYAKAAQTILELNDSRVAEGLQKLRAAIPARNWKDVPDEERVRILAAMQDSAFFGVVRAKALQVLLRDPATFAIVGYGGSTIQYGGYLYRGFNDINWLPAAATGK